MTQPAYPLADNEAMYDPAQVEEFLSTLFRNVEWNEGELVSLLGIGEKGTPQEGVFRERKIVAPAFMGGAHQHLKRWAAHQVAGFVVPAVLFASAAQDQDVKLDKVAALTAIILDIDSGDTEAKRRFVSAALGAPSLVVASGGTTEAGTPKMHLYWLLDEASEEIARIAELREKLALKVGGDPSFKRATQVIRVAGSVHAKNGKASVCRIIDRSDMEYSLDDLAEIIDDMLPMPGIEPPAKPSPGPLSIEGFMDFTPKTDTAVAALHRDVHENGTELTRWGEFSKVAGFNIAEARAGRITKTAAYETTYGWMLQHMVPPWPAARFDQEFQGLVKVDIARNGPFPEGVPTAVAMMTQPAAVRAIEPTPALFPDASSIPPRPWLFGRWFMRGIVTALVAPGGVGKSTLINAVALSCASGKEFLGKRVYGGPLTFWSWNLEDGRDNLTRQRVAASLYHRVGATECGDRLYVDSGPEGATLCTATEDRNGFTLIEPVFANVLDAIQRRRVDVLVIDPFVSSHAVSENDNTKIDAVAKAWARVAIAANCSIVLVHHTKKLAGEQVTAEAMRGAGALNNAARVTLTLNRMTTEQADAFGIPMGDERRYVCVADDKHNLTAAEAGDWFKLESVDLANGNELYDADNVGVITQWSPPKAAEGVGPDDLFSVQKAITAADMEYRRAEQTSPKKWVGHIVGNVLKIASTSAKGKKRIVSLIDIWLKSGALKQETGRGADRHTYDFINVGRWVYDPESAGALIHATMSDDNDD